MIDPERPRTYNVGMVKEEDKMKTTAQAEGEKSVLMRDLRSPKYRKRVEINRKKASKEAWKKGTEE